MRALAQKICVLGLLSFGLAVSCMFVGPTRALASEKTVGPLVSPGTGGVVLDGYGGLHPFGGISVDTSGAPYWGGWDIARASVLNPAGTGGWTLDGYGGIHAFGGAPPLVGSPYWPGWDIARALVVVPPSTGGTASEGYELDGYGGVHVFGGAPSLVGSPYWPGWDIARGLAITYDVNGVPNGGYVMDAWGGTHQFGAAPGLASPGYFPNHPVWQQIHIAGGVPYGVGDFGIVYTMGSGFAPDWTGYTDWGSWNIVRDIYLSSSSGGSGNEPSSEAAVATFDTYANGLATDGNVNYYAQIYSMDCEEAALQSVLSHEGIYPSQQAIIAVEGVDASVPGIGPAYTRGNPLINFIGLLNGGEGPGYEPGTYYGTVQRVANAYGANVVAAGTGISPSALYLDVEEGHPAVVWVTFNFQHYNAIPLSNGSSSWPWAGPHEHAVTILGVNPYNQTVLIYNPWNRGGGTYPGGNWVPMSVFESAYSTYWDMAVVLK